MKRVAQLRVYSAAVVLTLWAIAFALGLGTSRVTIVLLLGSLAAATVYAELERKHQREALRKGSA